jgi:hypothetical protein
VDSSGPAEGGSLASYMGVRARPVPISRCATEAFRLPVTGSSTVDPFLGKKARSSKAVSRPVGAADDAEVEIDEAGLERQHSLRTRQHHRDPPGLFSAHAASMISCREGAVRPRCA